ncbi:MAG: V-type ATPase 116kDa subunit family protein, partial [Sedimentisphaerales bacterium]
AATLSKNLLKLQILNDHYENLLNREQTKDTAPATEQTVIMEGWVKKGDFPRLEKIVSKFGASTLSKIEPAEDEEIPVEIENKNYIRPFEVITRLYGMPQHFEVDPTVFLAPFFALFFALCLTDAGYGLVIIALMIFLIKKVQGDKKLMWMLGICSGFTVVAGALTGGWFGDAIQQFIPILKPAREKMMWFDPFEDPMKFFYLALVLGYIQIMAGLVIAFVHNLRRRQYIAGLCDQLTLLVMLNSIVIFAVSKAGAVPVEIGKFFGILALIPAVMILLFSHREGSWGGRIGMGMYNLFSTIFYAGDVLSYIRLMALGMVTAGLAMAIIVMAQLALDIPYGIGILVMVLVLIGGHGFNIAINALGAFVHTLRLQYAEFFPKFFVGGGKLFEPLSKKYKHIHLTNNVRKVG